MQYFINSAWAIFRKDLILELRTRENIGTILPFSVVIAFIFNFTFDPSPQLMATVGPGIIWVAFIFSGTLGMNRLFLLEREFGTLEGLLTSPIPRESIFIGKFLGILCLLLVIQGILIPVFLVLYNLSRIGCLAIVGRVILVSSNHIHWFIYHHIFISIVRISKIH